VSNGSVMSPQPNHSDNNNEAKKVSDWVRTQWILRVRLEIDVPVKIPKCRAMRGPFAVTSSISLFPQSVK
jgi:hypothetical protein